MNIETGYIPEKNHNVSQEESEYERLENLEKRYVLLNEEAEIAIQEASINPRNIDKAQNLTRQASTLFNEISALRNELNKNVADLGETVN